MSAAPLRLVFDPEDDELEAARRCEADVFLATYGNTAVELAAEYGPYEDATGFLAVLDEGGDAVGAVRFIAPGPSGLKTLNDAGREPWKVDGVRSARSAGVDPERTWDVATIAVRPGAGRGGLCAGALYHGIVAASAANSVDYLVMIMDSHARLLLTNLGLRTHPLPGTRSGEYLGSPSSTPLWVNIDRTSRYLRSESPDAYRLIFQGVGLDGIALPTDWVWRRRGAVSRSPRDG